MNVYFMRHGETDWNTIKRIQGLTDIPLNENGIKLAELTSKAVFDSGIIFDRIYVSPLMRAKKTAEIMNVYSNAPVIEDKRIIEFCFGEGEGHTFEEIKTNPEFENLKNWFLCPEAYKAEKGAESYEAFFDRIDSFLEMLKAEERCISVKNNEKQGNNERSVENILIVCHGGVVRGLLKQMLNWSVNDFAKTKIPNCGMNLCTLTNGSFNLQFSAKTYGIEQCSY